MQGLHWWKVGVYMKTNREIAVYVLDALKNAGADHAQCFVSSGKVDELNVDGGDFSLLRSLFNSSITMKALKDGKKGVTSINKLDKESIDAAVRDCISAAKSSVSDPAESISDIQDTGSFSTGAEYPDKDKLFTRLKEFMEDVKTDYPKVILEQLISSFTQTDRLYMNTNGVEFKYRLGGYDISTMFSAHEGEKASSFNGYGARFNDLDTKFIDIGMQRALFAESEQHLNTKTVDGKFVGKVIITPACVGDILMMVLGNFASDSTLIDGTSPWKDKLGSTVASKSLSISTVPLDDRIVAGERFTAEGFRSSNMDIIKDGVLMNFMLSEYASRKTGFPRASNLGHNLYVEPGKEKLEDIIKTVDRGLMLNRFSGGQPGTNGDFSGVAKNSFMIENGKVTDALSETMISGNLAQMLFNVVAISAETICDGVTVLPWVIFDGITISGR